MIQIIHADVMDGLKQIPDQSVQCVVTSPPYWALRDYGIDGQIGLEKTPEEYVAKMVEVFREVKRVLRDDGTVWLNLGDSYIANGGGGVARMIELGYSEYEDNGLSKAYSISGRKKSLKGASLLKPKDLVGIPWRVAFALQQDGWYLRSDIIWSKPNPMPESVTDRPTKSHEYVFLLTKKARYYYDADAVREGYNLNSLSRYNYEFGHGEAAKIAKSPAVGNGEGHTAQPNPAGRNRRTVWEIATQPFPAAHFATFPEALVEPCIKAGTSERGCCSVCGAPWVRVVDKGDPEVGYAPGSDRGANSRMVRGFCSGTPGYQPKITTTGWRPSCSCNADVVPCIVLDPFGGSGTVGKVARDLKRKAILIELNDEYIKIARERLRLNEQLICAEGVP